MKLSEVRVGSWILGVGVVHVATTPLFYGDSLRSIAEGGVLFSIVADAEVAALRESAFWYATTGIGVASLGLVSQHAERHLGSPSPALPAAALLGLGLWGVLLQPQSGFWLFFPMGALAWRRRLAARRRVLQP